MRTVLNVSSSAVGRTNRMPSIRAESPIGPDKKPSGPSAGMAMSNNTVIGVGPALTLRVALGSGVCIRGPPLRRRSACRFRSLSFSYRDLPMSMVSSSMARSAIDSCFSSSVSGMPPPPRPRPKFIKEASARVASTASSMGFETVRSWSRQSSQVASTRLRVSASRSVICNADKNRRRTLFSSRATSW